VIASILVAQVGPLATAATAGGRNDSFSSERGPRNFGHDNGNHNDFRSPRGGHGGHNNGFGYGHGGHRDHSGRNIAIGLSALMLAAILAAQGHRDYGH